MEQEKPTPWYREPWMWLVFGLPATVVIAGIVTLIIAVSDPETIVKEPHQKLGFTVKKIEAN